MPRARLEDQGRRLSPTTSTASRYWNMARQRYCRRLASCSRRPRVSADRAASPAAHTRGESRDPRPTKAVSGERLTLRWREMDSNPRSPARETTLRDCLLIEEVRFAADLYGAFPVKRLFLDFA